MDLTSIFDIVQIAIYVILGALFGFTTYYSRKTGKNTETLKKDVQAVRHTEAKKAAAHKLIAYLDEKGDLLTYDVEDLEELKKQHEEEKRA